MKLLLFTAGLNLPPKDVRSLCDGKLIPFAHNVYYRRITTPCCVFIMSKRSNYHAPMRTTKRRRTAARPMYRRSIPRSLTPEVKQYFQDSLTTLGTNYGHSVITSDMSQGDGGNQFLGSKIRILRVRCYYDFSDYVGSLFEGVRLSLYIPKNPTAVVAQLNARDPWDKHLVTPLHEILLPKDASALTGVFDWTGPLNVEFDVNGTAALKNALVLQACSNGNGSNISSRLSYVVWYTE